MRIAFVNDTFLEGRGADTVIYELARIYGKKNQVYVLAGQTNIPEENFKFIKIDLPKLFTGKMEDFNFFHRMLRLRNQIKKIQDKYHFDVFLIFHSSLNIAFSRFPSFVVWLGSPETKNFLRKIVNTSLLRTLKSGRTVVISKYLRRRLKFIKDVEVIYCGISKDFRPLKKKKKNSKEYVLYAGRLEKHKNIEEIIRLSKELNFPLKIAGYGPEEHKLKEIREKTGAKVEFLGRVSRKNLIILYQNCSFFVSASKWEGFGLIFLEAAACEKPSIGYNVGAIPEVIINKKTGFVVNNFNEFKQKAKELIKNKKLRKSMGKNALEFSKKFDWKEIAKKYEKIFKRVKEDKNKSLIK